MKLGMVTYNMGNNLNRTELIALCKAARLEGLELRTTHKHGVEVALSPAERQAVKQEFADAGVAIAQLGSAFEFHSDDPAEVKKNIDGALEYAQLAADVGAPGIKVRPNGLQTDKGIPVEKTCEQIGAALRQVGVFAEGIGVQVRVEVHGKGASDPKVFKMIMDAASHKNVVTNWNSNKTDLDETGKLDAAFDLLKDTIAYVHITDIGIPQYPWQDLFNRLKGIGYDGWCMAELQTNPEPERFMKYYRTLFDFYMKAGQPV